MDTPWRCLDVHTAPLLGGAPCALGTWHVLLGPLSLLLSTTVSCNQCMVRRRLHCSSVCGQALPCLRPAGECRQLPQDTDTHHGQNTHTTLTAHTLPHVHTTATHTHTCTRATLPPGHTPEQRPTYTTWLWPSTQGSPAAWGPPTQPDVWHEQLLRPAHQHTHTQPCRPHMPWGWLPCACSRGPLDGRRPWAGASRDGLPCPQEQHAPWC